MGSTGTAPSEFEVAGEGPLIRGESLGDGSPVVLCHGLSATRRYVLHGSKAMARRGYRVITYDARGHGTSEPGRDGYGYEELAADLDRVVKAEAGEGLLALGGHSMGCHTAITWALANPGRVAALVLAGPVFTGTEGPGDLERWDRRAEALETEGPAAFGRVAAEGLQDEEARDTVERLATDRAGLHQHPGAVAEALRGVPRSRPFEEISDLGDLRVPVLVVASHDRFDPGHPFEVARRYAEAIPGAELVSEEPGESPLVWQGGRLSRVIADFLEGVGFGPGTGRGP